MDPWPRIVKPTQTNNQTKKDYEQEKNARSVKDSRKGQQSWVLFTQALRNFLSQRRQTSQSDVPVILSAGLGYPVDMYDFTSE